MVYHVIYYNIKNELSMIALFISDDMILFSAFKGKLGIINHNELGMFALRCIMYLT